MHVPEIPQHVLAKFEKFCLPREQAAFEKGRQAGRQEVMSGLDALRSFLPPSMHHNTPALAAVPVGPVLMSQPASPPDDDFDLDAIIKQIEGASPQDRQDLLLTAVAAVREAYLARGEDPTPVIESLKKMFADGGAEAAMGSEPVWMAWQQQQTKKGGIKAVGVQEHAGRTLYGKQAEAALLAQENRRKRQEAGERRDDLVGKVQRGEKLSDDEVHAMVDQHMASLSGQQLKEFRTGMMAKMGRVSAGKNKADRIAGLQQALKRFIQHAQENPVVGSESDQEPQEQPDAAATQGAEQPASGPETLEPDAEQPETLEPDQNEPGPNVKQTDYEPGMEPPAEPMDAEEVPLDFQDGSKPAAKAPAAKPQEKSADDHVEDLKRSRDALHRRANQMEAMADDPEHEASEEERAGMRERAAQLRKSAQVMHDLHQKHTAKPEEKPKEEAAAPDSPAAQEPAKREASAPVETPPPSPAGGDKVMAQRRVRLAEDLAAGAVPSNHPWTKKELEETGLAGKAKSAKEWRELAGKLRAERDSPAPEKPESAPAAEKPQEPTPAAAPEPAKQEAPAPAEMPPLIPAKPKAEPKAKAAPKPKTPPADTAPTPPPAPPPAPAPAPAAEPVAEPAPELPATHPSSRAKAALKKIKDNPDAPESLFDEAVAGKHGPAARKKASELSAQMGAKPYAAYAYAKHLRDNPDLIAPPEEKKAAAEMPKAAPTGTLAERAQGAKGLDAYDLFAEALAGKHGADAQKLAGDLHSENLGKLNGVQIAEKFAQSVGAPAAPPAAKPAPTPVVKSSPAEEKPKAKADKPQETQDWDKILAEMDAAEAKNERKQKRIKNDLMGKPAKKKADAVKPESTPAPAAKPPAENGGIKFDGAEYQEPEGGRLFDQGEGTSQGAGHAAINDTLERAGRRFGINLGGRKSLTDAVDDLGELDDKLGAGGKPFHSLAESYRKLADRVDQGDFDDDESAADSVAEELTADVGGVDRDAMQMVGAGDDGRYAHALHNKLADRLRDDLLARIESRQQDGPHQTPRDEYVADAERRTRARLKGGFSPQYVASEVERAKKAAGEKWDGSNEKAYLAGKSQVKPRWAQTDVELTGHPNGMGPAAHLHQAEVEEALADGKPVPDHVQKHYKIGKYAASETPPAPAEPAVKTPPVEPVRARADAQKVKPSVAKSPLPEVTPEQAKLLKGFGLTAADVPALAGPDGVVNWDKIAAGKVNWGRVMKAREREKRSLTKQKEKPKATGPVVPTGRPLTPAEQERADELRQRAAMDAENGGGDDDMLGEAMRKADEDPDGTGGVVKPSEWEQTVRPQVAARIAKMQERLAQGKDLRTGRQGEPLTQQDLDGLADTTGEADEQGNPLDANEVAKRAAPKGKAGRPRKWESTAGKPLAERMDKHASDMLDKAVNHFIATKGMVSLPGQMAERLKDDPKLQKEWDALVRQKAAEKEAARAANPKKEKKRGGESGK